MDLSNLINDFGVPLVVAGIICFYLRKDVVLPLVARWIRFLDCLEKILEESEKRAIINTAIAGSVDRRLANLEDVCERVARKLKLPPSTGNPPAQFDDFFSRPQPQPKADDPSGSASS